MKFSDLFKTEKQIKKDEEIIHKTAGENLNPLEEGFGDPLKDFFSVFVTTGYAWYEIWKAATEKDAKDIIKFLEDFDYILGSEIAKPKFKIKSNLR